MNYKGAANKHSGQERTRLTLPRAIFQGRFQSQLSFMGSRLLKMYLFNFTYLQIYFLCDLLAHKNCKASHSYTEVKKTTEAASDFYCAAMCHSRLNATTNTV